MHKSATQAKPVWVQNYGNGSIDLPRSLSQPFSNTPEILSFPIPEDLKSYISQSDFSIYEIATASVAILLHRFSAQDHFSLCTIYASEKPLSVPLSFSEDTLSTDIMACFKQSKLRGHECDPLSHDVAILTEQSSIYMNADEDGSFPHYDMKAKLIDFSFIQIDRRLFVEVAYNRRHIREWLVSRMMDALFTMLEDICTEKSLPVRKLRLLSPTKLVSLRPRRAHDAELYYFPVVKMLEQTVQENSNSTAIRLANGEAMSFGALNQAVNQFANYLTKIRVTIAPIGILGSGSELSIIATLACLKLAIPFVSIPTKIASSSFQGVIKKHSIIVCIGEKRGKSSGLTWICDRDNEEMRSCSTEFLSAVTSGSKLVGYYYTAGRGGLSRAIPVTHKLVFDQFAALQQLDVLTSEDRVLCYDDTGYIVSLHEFLTPLLNGATVVIPTDLARKSAGQLARELCEKQVSICYLKPSYLRGLIRENFFKKQYPLRKIFSYGAALCENDLLHISNPDLLFNSYLLTEVGGFVSYASCKASLSTVDSPISLDDSRYEIMVVDEKNRLLPVGALGQVLLTVQKKDVGHLLQRPEFSKSFFEAELFGKRRLCFKTDDYGRWVFGKKFLFSHHRKQQIRVFDCHANLNELAHKVVNIGPIKRACALSFHSSPGVSHLVVFIVSTSKRVTERFMRDTFSSLKSCIPNSILPKMLVAVADFDYNAMGGVDRNKMLARLKEGDYISRLSLGSV